ncbi:MAG: deoxyribose-phosphate aldolase [Clostridia bacterium]|nr:deoxyribose-phosphate aldolase [Clostridia bacterium]
MRTNLTPESLAKYFDQTLLKAYVTEDDFRAFCEESDRYGFAMVAINSAPVKFCKNVLKNSSVHVGAAIGFPLGQTTIEDKVFETEQAIKDGADEIDYVVNLVKLKSGDLAYVEEEMRRIVDICNKNGKISKVIFENCYLTDDEKRTLCNIALKVRPTFIKTSTGFGTPAPGVAVGATVEDVRLMKSIVGDAVKVKAAGGVRTLADALAMIEAGAERIGTSAGVKIVEELKQAQGK